MKIGISTSCLYPEYTERCLKEIAQNGVEATEIFFNANCELEPQFIKDLRAIKDYYGIKICSVHPTMSLAESFMLFSNYDRRYFEGLQSFKRYGEIAAELDANFVIMHGGKPNNAIDNRQYYERFAAVAAATKKSGGILLQENVVHFRAGSPQVLCEMSEYLGDDAAFCLDVKQSIRGGYSPFEVLELLGDKIKHLHLSDNTPENDCMLPLEGQFDFKAFIEKAVEKGYKGDAVIELYRTAFGDSSELFESHKKLCEKIF